MGCRPISRGCLAVGCTVGAICFLLTLSIVLSSWKLNRGQGYLAYGAITAGTQNSISLALAGDLSPMILTANVIIQSNPQVRYCSLPLDDPDFYASFNYPPLIDQLNALGEQSNTAMQSIGVISVDGAGSGTPDFTNKVSCEMALDTFKLGCEDYVYACTDNTTNFRGYCAYANGTVDLSRSVYNATDNGLTTEEVRLFIDQSTPALFLPIFNLLGQLSLTYERSFWCPGGTSAYAVALAQKNLGQLEATLQNIKIGLTGVAYVVEVKTGLLVAAKDQPAFDQQGQRLAPEQAANWKIRKSAEFLLKIGNWSAFTAGGNTFDPRYAQTSDLIIDIQPSEYAPAQAPLGFVQVVAVPSGDYAGWNTPTTYKSILVGLGVSVVLVAIAVGLVWWISSWDESRKHAEAVRL